MPSVGQLPIRIQCIDSRTSGAGSWIWVPKDYGAGFWNWVRNSVKGGQADIKLSECECSKALTSGSDEQPSTLVCGLANQQRSALRGPKSDPQASGEATARTAPGHEHLNGFRPRPTDAIKF